MGGRDVLDPAHPDGIVDVAELVDVGLRGGDLHFERIHVPPLPRSG
jgi:hypothetical protein